ncbi:MAG: carbohydrate kinase family protein [Bacteroidales bacterium]
MMTGQRIFCIGETVLDIIFKNDLPVTANPGGSMLNTAVSLGRAGLPVFFISEYGTDHAGNLIAEFLEKNGVSTDYVNRYSNGKTALALAFLDHEQDAEYSFYKLFPAERLEAPFPDVNNRDIVLFGSIYAIADPVYKVIRDFVRTAKSRGAFIIYDPNFRNAHLAELETLKPRIVENISLANLVRGSDEDFRNIFNAADSSEAFQFVNQAGCPFLIYTQSSNFVQVYAHGSSQYYEVPRVNVLSTVGAGDAFNAGVIYELFFRPWSENFPETIQAGLIGSGIRFSAEVCGSMDNYISVAFGEKLKITP